MQWLYTDLLDMSSSDLAETTCDGVGRNPAVKPYGWLQQCGRQPVIVTLCRHLSCLTMTCQGMSHESVFKDMKIKV